MTTYALPALSAESGLTRYIQEIQKFPLLDAEEEYMLAKAFREHGDKQAAHKLVTSHLRLVVKMAMGFRGYGLPIAEIISEGNIGLMQAVRRFEPEKGFRLSTYAMWWIKATIQEYVLRSWSLVKMGTTAAQKKLFFNLRRLKNRIQEVTEKTLQPHQVKQIATELNVTEEEVTEMDQRMSGSDYSLNATVSDDSESEFGDFLASSDPSQEERLSDYEEKHIRQTWLKNAMEDLNDRERAILTRRRLQDEPATLEDLSQEYHISRERVRQIEARALEKLQQKMLTYQAA